MDDSTLTLRVPAPTPATVDYTDGSTDSTPERPCTPPPTHTTLPALDDSNTQGGSLILIDPTTSGIIGTLTPASPGVPTQADAEGADGLPLNSEHSGEPSEAASKRRDPTYSYRLSISDLSLRTFGTPSTPVLGREGGDSTTKASPQAFEEPSARRREAGDEGVRAALHRSSWMTDDASFWTARGTLRLDGPSEGRDGGQEREREVVVAYVKTDAPLTDLFPPYIPTPARTSPTTSTPSRPTHAEPSTLRLTASHLTSHTHNSTSTSSPFPSRILHLFPRLSTLPRGGTSSPGSGLPGGVTQGLAWPEMDAGTIMASAGSHAEAAFWRLVMPGISGIYGWTGVLGQAYEQIAAYLPIPLLTSADSGQASLLIDSSVPSAEADASHQSRLYSEETIYTLRLPAAASGETGEVDLGPTVRPVWVKKRAAFPVFEEREEGWGREPGGMSSRLHI